MKKLIKHSVEAAKTNRTAHIQSRSTAKKVLAKYNQEQIDLVDDCLDEINSYISNYYADGPDPDRSIGRLIFDIKKDYLSEALEYEILSKEEFDELYDALDIIRSDRALAVS